MRLALRPKPETLADRAEAAAGDVIEFARSLPERLDSSRKRALAVAGGAAGAAAGFVFWRSRHSEDGPSVHHDPAKPPTPWKATPPPGNGSPPTATTGAGTRSK